LLKVFHAFFVQSLRHGWPVYLIVCLLIHSLTVWFLPANSPSKSRTSFTLPEM